MKGLMITGDSSGQGKTVFTMVLCRTLRNMGYDVSPFKTGPDYIDPKYHALAASHTAGNLDYHMQGDRGLKIALGLNLGDLAIIEGAMGYFDGIGNTFEGSSFDISERIDTNAILVVTPGAQMFSLIPKLIGMTEFANGRLVGIVLNKVTESYYNKIVPQIEKYTNLKCLGYLPEDERLSIQSRYMGLLKPEEVEGLDEYLDDAAELMKEHIDIESMLDFAREIKPEKVEMEKTGAKILIAKDDAFCFHYNENDKITCALGNVEYFSPMKDEKIENADLIILGGGYPELYLKELSENTSMLKSILEYSKSGGKILGIGAGLMYLSESIDGYKMVGALPGSTIVTDKTQRFGYNKITLLKDCLLGNAGDEYNAKEFHKSKFETKLKPLFTVSKEEGKNWECGYQLNNTLGMYQHLNFAGNAGTLEKIIKK